MSRRWVTVAGAVGLSLTPFFGVRAEGAVPASTPALKAEEPAKDILDLTLESAGVRRSVFENASRLRTNLMNSKKMMEAPAFDRYYEVMTTAFDPHRTYQTLKTYLKAEMTDEEFRAVNAWYERPASKRLVEMEAVAERPEFQKKLERWVLNYRDSLPDEDRMDLIERIDSVAWFGSEHFLRNMATHIQMEGLRLSFCQKMSESSADYRVYRSMEALNNALTPLFKLVLQVIYEDASGKELQDFSRELSRTEMRKFHRYLAKAVAKANADALNHVRTELHRDPPKTKNRVGSISESVPL